MSLFLRNGHRRKRGIGFPTRDALIAQRCERAAPQNRGTVVAFHTTDAVYQHEANRLRSNLELLGLAYDIVPVSSRGEWVRNAGQKPDVLCALREKHRGPLIYVDVDAVFHCNPWPDVLQNWGDCDIGFYRTPEGELLSGTLLIGDTDGAKALLHEWRNLCQAEPDMWDQRALDACLDKASGAYAMAELPAPYCWIFDKRDNAGDRIVIEHLQASREGGKKKLGLFRSRRLVRRRARLLQIEQALLPHG